MNKNLMQLVCLGVLLGVAPIYAQRKLECNVPFDFKAGPTTMTAGKYSVTFPVPGTVQLRNEATNHSAFILTNAKQVSRNNSSKLVFSRYAGEHYFLSEIWSQGYDQGRVLPKSKGEIELARNLQDRVTIASR